MNVKQYCKQLLIVVGIISVFLIARLVFSISGMTRLGPSDWIQLVASVMSVFAFGGLLLQIYIQNMQRKTEKRPHLNLSFKSYVQAGDVAVSKSNSWDFEKYYKSMAIVNTVDNSVAIDVLFVATYESKEEKVIKDYLFLAGLGKKVYSLDFKHGRDFQKLEIYFRSSVEELGKVTFKLSDFNVAIPQYTWGRKLKREYRHVLDETSKNLLDNKSDFSIYEFDESDLKGASVYNAEMRKRHFVNDSKTEAINYYLYGNSVGKNSDNKK
ncbi:hypothetical protein DY78_GL000071 [Lactiplantibacillus fabifermentans DSM 21115]|uniref:Uncharacterized protein n=1 Tax=Lactiplantibacillus fabifermentans DSM 21115 TaxID=1413187 RepID=A0A0R2NWD5_9LACO|nr:hypothetical protein DY78_GL000071 [Lactiplantibacillus fabifermentans DSM 21115]